MALALACLCEPHHTGPHTRKAPASPQWGRHGAPVHG